MSRMLLLRLTVRLVLRARELATQTLMETIKLGKPTTFALAYELWVDKICANIERAS